jgi:hypothetical protein
MLRVDVAGWSRVKKKGRSGTKEDLLAQPLKGTHTKHHTQHSHTLSFSLTHTRLHSVDEGHRASSERECDPADAAI